MNANERQTLTLAAGQVLTITAAAGVTGLVVRLPRVPGGGEAQSVTVINGADLTFGPYADVERFEISCDAGTLTATAATPDPALSATDIEVASAVAAAGALTSSQTIYVNKNRTDTYTADGTIFRPYKTVLAALTVINADTGKEWIVKIDRGTYSDNLTITGPRSIRFEGTGVTLSGTILINSGVGSYDRIEFVGCQGFRADKGPMMTISGKITATRTNDSLIYVSFQGCYVTGEFEATTNGTWVLQYGNSRVSGAITGTLAENTQLDNSILIETYGYNKFAGAITGIVSLYNCNETEFAGVINTTQWFENRFINCTFTGAGAITFAPQGGASSSLIYLDATSYKSLAAKTPTLTGATYSYLEGGAAYPASANANDFLVGDASGGWVVKTLAETKNILGIA
jgi:hypothetical protein